jgi:hypothetical protein|tara:strand:- start:380 stop:820 length:441 start_codon:yes stop_codon:yes gene_type:complete
MSTTYERKPFSEGNHASNDPVGKDIVLEFLRSKGIKAIENPDDYGVDIMAPIYEVERRTIYQANWPYKTVHVPERKTKFLVHDIYYVVVVHHATNKPSNSLMICRSNIIRKCNIEVVPNNSVPDGEGFYDVPMGFWKIEYLPRSTE